MAPQKAKKTIPIKRKNMHINNPLPEIEAGIANEAKKRDMIVSTHNCVVLGLVENGTNKPKFMRVNEPEDHDRLKAIKKNKTATTKSRTDSPRRT